MVRKPFRLILTCLGALLLGLIVLIALPPVQARLAVAVAKGVAGVQAEVGYLWAGPRGVTFRDLHVVSNGVELTIAAGNVDLASWSSLSKLELDIETAALRGVDVAFARADADVSSDRARRWEQVYSGVGERATLPRWLTLRRLEASGRLLLEATPDVEIGGPWELSVASLGPDSTASAGFAATFDAGRSGGLLARAGVRASVLADLDADAAIERLDVRVEVDPAGQGRGIAAVGAATFGPSDEHIELTLVGEAGVQLAAVDALLLADGQLDATWEARLTPGVVRAFARGASTADLSGRTTGRVQADLAARRGSAALSAEFLGNGWEAFDPRLAEFGSLAMSLVFDGTFAPGAAVAETLQIGVTSEGRGEILRVQALQPFAYETGSWLVDPETWGEPALQIRAANLPLRWVRKWIPAAAIDDGELTGTVDFVRERERVTELLVREPLRVADLRVAAADGTAQVFDVALTPHASLSNGALDAEIEELTITAPTGLRVTLRGRARTSRADWPRAELDAEVAAIIPALIRVLPQLGGVRGRGRAEIDLEALALQVTAANFEADTVDGRELLSMDLSARRPLSVQLPEFAIDWNSFESRTATLILDRVPIERVGAYVPELEFRGGELTGRLSATRSVARGLTLEAEEPLRIANLRPIFRGRPARGTLTATLIPHVRLTSERSLVAVEELTLVTSEGNTLNADFSLEASQGSDAITVALSLRAHFAELAGRYGLRIGGLRWQQHGELNPTLKQFDVRELIVALESAAGEEIVQLESLRPFSMAIEPFGVVADDFSADLLHATVSPLRLQQLVPGLGEFDLAGSLPEGEFYGRAEPDGTLVLAAEDPLVFRDVSMSFNGAPLLDRVTAGVRYEIAYSGDGLQARRIELEASDSGGSTIMRVVSRVSAPLNDTRLVRDMRLSFDGSLEQLARQPVLAGLPPFTSGRLSASLDRVVAPRSAMAFELMLTDAATDEVGRLPNVDLRLDARADGDERMSFVLPVQMESMEAGTSDLLLEGNWSAGDGRIVEADAVLKGQRIAASHLQPLMALVDALHETPLDRLTELAPLSDDTLSLIARMRSQRDQTPFWTERLLSRASIEIDRLELAAFDVERIEGMLEVTPDAATLRDIRASVLGAEFTAAANLSFETDRPEPYALGFRTALDGLELRDVFLAVSPGTMPTAEGRVALTGTLEASGLNPLDLGLSSLGRLQLTGRDGVFRGLAAHAGAGSTASRVIGILTFSRELKAIGRLLEGLGEIRFEEAEIVLERSEPGHLELSRLLVRSPQLEIDASGTLSLARQRALLRSPMELTARVGASDDVEILFDGMGLLGEEASDSGYRELTSEVRIGGTPSEPDTSDFWRLLEEAAENSRGAFGVGLRALNRRLESRDE